ncbi:hypothetical protein ASD40_16575 [Paenibacillus sp. Root444D2]|nr:hypothetical protein ASD40_16575 [Paenibacillus sp. Root444D2]KRE48490.1 hypothetical protein ASG85_05680 [Paenibacillus sp. Soil724D2]
MYVAEMSLQELDEMFEIRIELEGLAIKKAAPKIPSSVIKELEQAMQTWSSRKPNEYEEKIRFKHIKTIAHPD